MKAKDIIAVVAIVAIARFMPDGLLTRVPQAVLADAQSAPPSRFNGAPVGSGFTYQGQLMDSGAPADGIYDLRFILFDAEVGGSQIGPIVYKGSTVVSGGLFSVELDFGASAFAGEARWLEIGVGPGGSGTYTVLSDRQRVTPTPNALYASNADTVDGQHASAFMAAGTDNWVNTTGDTITGPLTLVLGAPSIYFRPTAAGGADYGLSANKDGLYVLVDENIDGYWDSPHPLQFDGRDATFGGDVAIDASVDVVGSAGVIADVRNTGTGNSNPTLRVQNNSSAYALWARNSNATTANAAYFDGIVDITSDLNIDGDLTVDGAATGFFPRPAWDSGWLALALNETRTLTHGLGGDTDDYFVDITCIDPDGKVNNMQIGEEAVYDEGLGGNRWRGVYFQGLTNSIIPLHRNNQDYWCAQVRARIWVIN